VHGRVQRTPHRHRQQDQGEHQQAELEVAHAEQLQPRGAQDKYQGRPDHRVVGPRRQPGAQVDPWDAADQQRRRQAYLEVTEQQVADRGRGDQWDRLD